MTRYADPKYIFEETMKTYDARLVDKLFLTLLGLHLSSVIIMSSMLIMNLHKINNFNIYLTGFVLILFLVEFLIIAKIGVYVCKIFRTEKRARQWIAVGATIGERKDRKSIFRCYRRRKQAELWYEQNSNDKNKGRLEATCIKWENESIRFKEKYFSEIGNI